MLCGLILIGCGPCHTHSPLNWKMKTKGIFWAIVAMITTVEGLYYLQVRISDYTNAGRCPGCIEVLSTEPGCCDLYNKFASPCESDERCDSYFTYFVRRLDSTERGKNCTQFSSSSERQRISLPNMNDATIDFGNATVLGLVNPFILRGLDNKWNGIQLLVEVCDSDPEGQDDLIDIIPINIAVSSVTVGIENRVTTYTGLFNYTIISLSFSILCVERFSGPNCSECASGFTGMQCDVNIDDCVGVNCGEHGECVDGVDTFTCRCDQGFNGVVCDEELVILNSQAIMVGGIVGGVAVLCVLLLLLTALVLFMKNRKKGQAKPVDSDIKLSRNAIHGIEENIEGREAQMQLDNNISYIDSRHKLKMKTNVSYVECQQPVKKDDYEYTQYENYDYVS